MDALRFWQNKVFSVEKDPKQGKVNPNSRKADTYRTLMCTVFASTLDKESCHTDDKKATLSPNALNYLASKLMDNYGSCVDDISGINNFADEALALTKYSKGRNESKNWTTSLPVAGSKEFDTFLQEISVNATPNIDEIDEKSCRILWQSMSKSRTNPSAVRKIPQKSGLQNVKHAQRNQNSGSTDTKTMPSFFRPFSEENNSDVPANGFSGNSRSNTITAVRHPHSTYIFSGSHGDNDPPPRASNSGNNFSWFPKERNPLRSGYDRACREVPTSVPRTEDVGNEDQVASTSFCTARDQYIADQQKKKYGNNPQPNPAVLYESRTTKKTLGTRRGPSSKFVPPIANQSSETSCQLDLPRNSSDTDECDKLKNIDPKMVELMMNEILDHGPPVTWDDIAGLEFAKNTIMEIVVWPMLRPDIFSGLRGPPKGLLLFGPPGTGKTLIGKCIASQAKATFFCISASSLTSKWVGEGEKLVKALFMTARCYQPAVIFIDEIDSLLSQRSDSEHESSRRIKTEFLVQLDGANTQSDERLLIVGATNRPQELDEAARRRLVKRLYIPLPTLPARKMIIVKLLSTHRHALMEEELDSIGEKTEGYSGADMANLCKEAALGPIRDLNFSQIERISPDEVRPIAYKDFVCALKHIRASVSDKDLSIYEEWNNRYGSGGF